MANLDKFVSKEALTSTKLNKMVDALNTVDTSVNNILKNYATQADLTSLTTGTFYGFFSSSSSLTETGTTNGYAYVTSSDTGVAYDVYNYDASAASGSRWSDSGVNIDSVTASAVQDSSTSPITLKVNDSSVKTQDNVDAVFASGGQISDISTYLKREIGNNLTKVTLTSGAFKTTLNASTSQDSSIAITSSNFTYTSNASTNAYVFSVSKGQYVTIHTSAIPESILSSDARLYTVYDSKGDIVSQAENTVTTFDSSVSVTKDGWVAVNVLTTDSSVGVYANKTLTKKTATKTSNYVSNEDVLRNWSYKLTKDNFAESTYVDSTQTAYQCYYDTVSKGDAFCIKCSKTSTSTYKTVQFYGVNGVNSKVVSSDNTTDYDYADIVAPEDGVVAINIKNGGEVYKGNGIKEKVNATYDEIFDSETGESKLTTLALKVDDRADTLDGIVLENTVTQEYSSSYTAFRYPVIVGGKYRFTNNAGITLNLYSLNKASTSSSAVVEVISTSLKVGESVDFEPTDAATYIKILTQNGYTGSVTVERILANAKLREDVDNNEAAIIELRTNVGDKIDRLNGIVLDNSITKEFSTSFFAFEFNVVVGSIYKFTNVKGNTVSIYTASDSTTSSSPIETVVTSFRVGKTIEFSPTSSAKYIRIIGQAFESAIAIETLLSNKKLKEEIDNKAALAHSHTISDVTSLQSSLDDKIPYPTESKYGTNGMLLSTLGNGTTKWIAIEHGKFYGYYKESSLLPTASDEGYAYVGETAPFAIWNYQSAWSDSGSVTYLDSNRRINVKDFGAIGDGATDDVAAIASALEYARENLPCEVYFPKGDYGILTGGYTLHLPLGSGGLKVTGDGGALSRLCYLPEYEHKGDWYALRIYPETTPTDESEYLHDITFSGLGVYDPDPWNHALNPEYNNASGVAHEETHAWDFQYIKRLKIENCFINSVGDECFDMGYCIDTIVTNNHIYNAPGAGNNGGAISVNDGCKNVIVSNNIIVNNIHSWNYNDAAGTVVLGKRNFGINIESQYAPIYNVSLIGNTISDLQGTGINMSASQEGGGIYNLLIKDNNIHDCTCGIGASGSYTIDTVIIDGNDIHDCVKYDPYQPEGYSGELETVTTSCISSSARALANAELANNNLDGAMRGVYITNGCSIRNTNISNIRNTAIYIGGAGKIFGCYIDKTNYDSVNVGAIQTYNKSCIIKDCILSDIQSSIGIQGNNTTPIQVYNSKITLAGVGQAVTLANIIDGVETNGRIRVPLSDATVRDCKITSDVSLGTHAISIEGAQNVVVTGCRINTIDYNAINENATSDYNMICNNIVKRPIAMTTGGGTNTIKSNNLVIS